MSIWLVWEAVGAARGGVYLSLDFHVHKRVRLEHLVIGPKCEHIIQIVLVQQMARAWSDEKPAHVSVGDVGKAQHAQPGNWVA